MRCKTSSKKNQKVQLLLEKRKKHLWDNYDLDDLRISIDIAQEVNVMHVMLSSVFLIGFEGVLCEKNIDDCSPDPCHHGTCVDGIASFTCICVAGYTGYRCENQINECHSNPCQHGSKCIDLVNKYLCHCQPGTSDGPLREEINECASNPCKNGGTCVDGEDGFSCLCPEGFHDPHCYSEVDECSSSPCAHGTCHDDINGRPFKYQCKCEPGWTGTNCDMNHNECESNPCQHYGTCTDYVNGYRCKCKEGFQGMLPCCAYLAHININDCASSPCLNQGTCIDGIASHFSPQDGTVRMSWLLASLTHVRTMVFVITHLTMKGLFAVVHQAGKVL
uniref:EGF-like domain-containing protein n=1 Tax=Naja naja TaxID=35670 RepID=A0A8C6XKE3_NAJNA